MIDSTVAQSEVGMFVDSIAGQVRTPAAVAGRLLEEVVELCLEAGLNAGEIHAHVSDSLTAQCLKLSATYGPTFFPSDLPKKTFVGRNAPSVELFYEVGDVGLLLKDFAWVSGVPLIHAEREKFSSLRCKEFHVSPKGTLYTKKDHIKG